MIPPSIIETLKDHNPFILMISGSLHDIHTFPSASFDLILHYPPLPNPFPRSLCLVPPLASHLIPQKTVLGN